MKLKEVIHTDLPFVIYKKPDSGKLNIIQTHNNDLIIDQNFVTDGFYFVPFDMQQHPAIVFPDKLSVKKSFFVREFEQENGKNKGIKINEIDDSTAGLHRQKVKQALQYIRQNSVKKIIISRKQRVYFENFDLFSSLLKLMNTYESSFVYLWHHPEAGTWMGATPELLGKYENGIFKTVALAGTLPVNSQEPLIWKNKEINEQQIVTDYIAQSIRASGIDAQVGQPETFYQANLAHIRTFIQARTDWHTAKQLMQKLHPTPAVCGLPVEKARQLIRDIEQYDRKYYTGFLGELSANGIEMYVNLRCMECSNNHLDIYVGGGIVENSQPEKEWEETEIKSEVLLSVFK